MRLYSYILFFSIFVWITPSYANQLSFNKSSINGTTSFFYKWRGVENKIQQLGFKLPTRQLIIDKNSFKPFDNRVSNDYVYKKMQEYTKKNNSKLANIKVKRVRTGFEVEAKGVSPIKINKAMAALKNISKTAMDDYVTSNHYKYIDEKSIRPDHTKIAKQYISLMRPVAQAISLQTNGNHRDVANFALSFVQAIPYNILKSRYYSNGAGFQMPYGLLMTNKGDCDTKSVAFASIIRNFYPKLRILMIYIPGHAFIGISSPVQSGDKYLNIGGTAFVLAEPVGPNQAKLGDIAKSSFAKLLASDYTYDEIPF